MWRPGAPVERLARERPHQVPWQASSLRASPRMSASWASLLGFGPLPPEGRWIKRAVLALPPAHTGAHAELQTDSSPFPWPTGASLDRIGRQASPPLDAFTTGMRASDALTGRSPRVSRLMVPRANRPDRRALASPPTRRSGKLRRPSPQGKSPIFDTPRRGATGSDPR